MAVLLALLGSTIYSAGVIFQKKGVRWADKSVKAEGGHWKLFIIWFAGILLSNAVSALPIALASKWLASHVISALSGWNIACVMILSHIYLKEKLRHVREILSIALIIVGITSIGLSSAPSSNTGADPGNLRLLVIFPFCLLLPVITGLVRKKGKVLFLSVFSGMMGGLTLVLMNILVKENSGNISDLITSINLYVYLFVGISSFVALQAAYRTGDLIMIMPLQASMAIIYPLSCSFILFKSLITDVHIVSTGLIVISCWSILRKR